METLTVPRGLIADLVTPLRSDGAIDGPGLGRLLERVSPHAQAVLLASPRTGEGESLGPEQRSLLLEHAIKASHRSLVPFFVWVTQESEEGTIETIHLLNEVLEKSTRPCDLFLVDTPLYYHSNRKLPSFYERLCSMVKGPILLHNDPELIGGLAKPLKRNNIRTSILKELVGLEKIGGVIFSGSLDRAHNYQKASRRRTDFRIYDGDEAHFLDYPSMSGVVSAGANLAPKAWGEITRSSLQLSAHKKNYPDHLHRIWESGDYLRNIREIYLQVPTALVKGVLSDIGVIETPLCTFSVHNMKEDMRRLKELMTGFGDYPPGTGER